MPGKAKLDAAAQLARQFEHALPFGEHDHFHVRIITAFFEDFLQFGNFGAGALFGVEDVIGVADHAHHIHMPQQFVLLGLGERAAFGNVCQSRHHALMTFVFTLLFGAERHEIVAIGAFRQLGFHLGFAPAEHGGLDALVQLVEIVVTGGAATLIQLVVFTIETEERPEQGWIQEIHQGVQFVNPVFDRRAGEDKCVTAAQTLNRLGGFGAPVLDSLRFIQHDDVWLQALVHVEGVGEHLLVVHNGEERQGRR